MQIINISEYNEARKLKKEASKLILKLRMVNVPLIVDLLKIKTEEARITNADIGRSQTKLVRRLKESSLDCGELKKLIADIEEEIKANEKAYNNIDKYKC